MIDGGNRMSGFESEIKISGNTYDPDIRPEEYAND